MPSTPTTCEHLGIEPQRRIFHGSDAWRHVISRNLHRRHLNESQRAMIAARIATRREGRPETSPIGEVSPPPTHAEASKALGVGSSSTTRAKNVIAKGTPALQELVSVLAVTPLGHARGMDDHDIPTADELEQLACSLAMDGSLGRHDAQRVAAVLRELATRRRHPSSR